MDEIPNSLKDILYCEPGRIFCRTKRVLVAVDGSDCSGRAITVAFEVAEMTKAELHILHVVPTPSISQFAFISDSDVDEVIMKYEKGGRLLLEGYKKAGEEYKLDIHLHLEKGLPSERIVAVARDLEIDLIVIGSRGMSGGKRGGMGSSTERVINNTDVPVIVVK